MMTSSRDELIRDGATPAVAVDHLTVVRGTRTALDDVTVRIPRGTITGVLGPSGCGKTTLIRSIVGTQIVAGGTVTVLGRPAGSAELRHRVGYVTQDATIYEDLRVIDNVRYFASLYGSGAQAADEAVANVGLDDHRTALCGNLSGGQRTRASLACALVARPELLVLDEPTVGLDPVLRVDLWEQFHHLARSGTTLLVSSHVMDEADHCGDLLLLREGRLLAHTTPKQPTRGHGMSVTGGSVSLRHPAQHRTRTRLSPQAYLATTGRILRQLVGDHRSVAMILVVPALIITLMYFMFQDVPHRPGAPSPFNNACLIMLGVFPLIVMFLITSITMQRERVSGTLERILTTPLRRVDLLAAYGTAFSIAAAAQATLACLISFWLLGLDTAGNPGLVFVIAIVNAVLGVGLGLLCSAFARTEFQAVQFMPVVIVPQLLLCGIIVPRDVLPEWLQWISNAMPASYALEALREVSAHPDLTATAARDIAIVVAFAVVAMALAAATLRRRTP